jgi:transposase
MNYNFLPYIQDQIYLMPPALQEWVGQESLPRFVNDVIDLLAEQGRLASFYRRYRSDGWGRAAYHPVMMVKVLVYAYCRGVTSSRQIARGLDEEIGLRYLSANQCPDFRTISEFRKEHLEALGGLFVEVLALCRQAGLAKMGRVALDGRKVAGNAALDRNRTREGLRKEVERILEEAERVDTEEDARWGDQRGDELPEGWRTHRERMERLKKAQAELGGRERELQQAQREKISEREQQEADSGRKKRGRKPKPPEEVRLTEEAKANTTDPESRILKSRKGWVQGYNGQAMVDCESQVIVACALTQDENDVRQLGPMLERVEEQAGARPGELTADAGYWSEENAEREDEDTTLYVATTKDWKQRKAMRESGPPRGRIPRDATLRDRMERRLRTRRGRAVYRQRGSTVEPVFGQMEVRGLNRFRLRGIKKTGSEWLLWCTTHNLLKLWRSGFDPAVVTE